MDVQAACEKHGLRIMFGGSYPHAYECGVDHMKLIENDLNGNANEKCIGAYEEGIAMMKYNEVMVR